MFAIGPIFVKTDDELYIKITWSLFMFVLFVLAFVGALIRMQYYVIKDGKIIVKSIFGVIVDLDIADCRLIIQRLPTVRVLCDSWLCIYLKNSNTQKSS